jgi:hypothetical protein
MKGGAVKEEVQEGSKQPRIVDSLRITKHEDGGLA